MMKKIAILTWTKFENYGTYFQAYALNYYLNQLGYNTETIEYGLEAQIKKDSRLRKLLNNPIHEIIHYFLVCINVLIKNTNRILIYEKQTERHNAFISFKNKNIKMTSLCTNQKDLELLENKYDYFICGSDQIWNPNYLDGNCFLEFVRDNKKKVAYAPSFGVSVIDNQESKKTIKQYLQNFYAISVREETGAEIIKNLIGKDVPVLIDPTFLLSAEKWMDVMNNDYETPNNYILCYFLGHNEEYWNKINEYAIRNKLKVVIIPIYEKDLKRSTYVLNNVGPAEFVKLIKNANLICTDSFHGSVFSIIFNKKFITFLRFKEENKDNQNSRVLHLLKMFKTEFVLYKGQDRLDDILSQQINFELILDLINEQIKNAKTFLINSLNHV